ncbi:MAG: DUF3352 domain-containing protein [Spirochaetales bacterium]|nr:DUF3352 domain-containing protein [Spirochaetales bacterium]
MKLSGKKVVVLFVLLFTALAVNAQANKVMYVPADAALVISMDLNQGLKSKISQDLIALANNSLYGTASDEQGEDLDAKLEEEFGLVMKDLGNIVFFTTRLSPDMDDMEFGLSLQLVKKKASTIMNSLKKKHDLAAAKYKNVSYLKSPEDGDDMFAFTNKNYICLANSEAMLKKMIDVMKGAKSVLKNKEMNRLVAEFGKATIFAVGLVSKEMVAEAEKPFNALTGFGMGIGLSKSLKIGLKINMTNAKDAELAKSRIESAIGMIVSLIAGDSKELNALRPLIETPIKYSLKKASVDMKADYSRDTINKLIKAIPLIMASFEPKDEPVPGDEDSPDMPPMEDDEYVPDDSFPMEDDDYDSLEDMEAEEVD